MFQPLLKSSTTPTGRDKRLSQEESIKLTTVSDNGLAQKLTLIHNP